MVQDQRTSYTAQDAMRMDRYGILHIYTGYKTQTFELSMESHEEKCMLPLTKLTVSTHLIKRTYYITHIWYDSCLDQNVIQQAI